MVAPVDYMVVLKVDVLEEHKEKALAKPATIIDIAIEEALNKQFPLRAGFEWWCGFDGDLSNALPTEYCIVIFPVDTDAQVAGINTEAGFFLRQEFHFQNCPDPVHQFGFNLPLERFLPWLKSNPQENLAEDS